MSLKLKLRESIGLYFITDAGFGKTHDELAEAVLKAGVRIIQFREKKASTKNMVETARRIRKLCDEYNALFFVNDRIDVALACYADGVHLGQEDMPASIAKEIFDGLIGVSAENGEEAIRAEKDGADYIGAGPVFETTTKEDAGSSIGIEGLRRIVDAVSIPVVGIGGITKHNAQLVLQIADGIAVISAIAASSNPEREARELLEIVEKFKKEKD
jgi:thiamine-phosphate pyrophosphorylase